MRPEDIGHARIGAAADVVEGHDGVGVNGVVAAQDVGDLADQQANVVPLEEDLIEFEQRPALGHPRRQGLGRRLDPRGGQPALHAPDRFDQADL